MNEHGGTVVGIDVGGEKKGFHAVALVDGKFACRTAHRDPVAIVDWCLHHRAEMVGVDAPCKWSRSGSSRLAERELGNHGIHCFATPTESGALNRDFYKWVFNGQRLYLRLVNHYRLFNGERTRGRMCIETFPHAVVCAMAGKVVSARPKSRVRREALLNRCYDIDGLPNIDFVDAALCAVAAGEFGKGKCQCFGDPEEGIVVVPVCHAVESKLHL